MKLKSLNVIRTALFEKKERLKAAYEVSRRAADLSSQNNPEGLADSELEKMALDAFHSYDGVREALREFDEKDWN